MADWRDKMARGAHRPRHDGWSEAKRREFLRVLGEGGCVTEACRHVGLSTTSAYRHRRQVPAFDRGWGRALAKAKGVLVKEARRRAIDGWEEEIWWRGEIVGVRRRWSDKLLIELMRVCERREARELIAIDTGEFETAAEPERESAMSDIDINLMLNDRLDKLAERLDRETYDGADPATARRFDWERPGWREEMAARLGRPPKVPLPPIPPGAPLPGLPGGAPIDPG
jgi:hypothetical protein